MQQQQSNLIQFRPASTKVIVKQLCKEYAADYNYLMPIANELMAYSDGKLPPYKMKDELEFFLRVMNYQKGI